MELLSKIGAFQTDHKIVFGVMAMNATFQAHNLV